MDTQQLVAYIEELQVMVDIIEHAENIIFAKDIDGKYTLANNSSIRYFGKRKEDIIGKNDVEIFGEQEGNWNMAIDKQILVSGQKRAFEKHVKRNDIDVYFYVVKDLVKDKIGRVVGITGVVIDITQYKLEQQDIYMEHERTKQLELTNRLRSNFMANISHNLRTPLMGILGAAVMNVDVQGLPSDIKKDLELFRYSAELLLNIVDEMTAYGPLLEGEIKVTNRPFYISTIVRFMEELFGYIAKEQGFKFTVVFNQEIEPEPTRTLVLGDMQRIIQALNKMLMMTTRFASINDNLVLNIDEVPSTETGWVDITFKVSSSSIIPEIVQERMFDILPNEPERDIFEHSNSLGLETYISRKIIESLNGTLLYKVDDNQMGYFIAKLSLKETATREAIMDTTNNKKILVADDNVINQHVLLRMMTILGAKETVIVNDGLEALDAFKKAIDDNAPFDFVFMDIMMPRMNGIESTKNIRLVEQANNITKTPIFAVTAFVTDEDRLACYDAGMTGFLGKPVTQNVLLDTILNFNTASN